MFDVVICVTSKLCVLLTLCGKKSERRSFISFEIHAHTHYTHVFVLLWRNIRLIIDVIALLRSAQ